MFFKIGVLKNFSVFTGKQVFFCKYCLKITFFIEYLRGASLSSVSSSIVGNANDYVRNIYRKYANLNETILLTQLKTVSAIQLCCVIKVMVMNVTNFGSNISKKFAARKLQKLRIWSHLLKKFLMENFIFCAVSVRSFGNVILKLHFSRNSSAFPI